MNQLLFFNSDPLAWSVAHVRQWLSWAVCQFGLSNINVNSSWWNLSGRVLFGLSQTEFRKLVPDDPGDVFYMHFELLRRTNVVGKFLLTVFISFCDYKDFFVYRISFKLL